MQAWKQLNVKYTDDQPGISYPFNAYRHVLYYLVQKSIWTQEVSGRPGYLRTISIAWFIKMLM